MTSITTQVFEQNVRLKYQLYNSLFLTLPFDLIHQTGTLLPILSDRCVTGFDAGKSPEEILDQFFDEYFPDAKPAAYTDILFNFVKYIERQVVLFDAVEEAAFNEINELDGPGTLEELLTRVDRENVESQLLQKLSDFRLRIVLTAHPTQFYPGPVLGIINDLSDAIRENDIAMVKTLLLQLGKTPFINREKPTPLDEARSLIWFLKNTFYRAIPSILQKIKDHLARAGKAMPDNNLIQLGFWPGGDRDGNPFVTPEITKETMGLLNRVVLSCYHEDARDLRRRLTFAGVQEKITNIEYRLFDSIHDGGKAYTHPDELMADVNEIIDLLHKKHNGLFAELVEDFRMRIRHFGFHMATLDIRQDSRKHEALIQHLLQQAGFWDSYQKMSEADKIHFLRVTDLWITEENADDDTGKDIIGSIRMLHQLQDQFGEQSCHRYIISNTRGVLDMVIVETLIRWVKGDTSKVDIVPLFESVDTLKNSGEVMRTLYRDAYYNEHLTNRGSNQTIMLGFSDGTKDGGYLRANWSIFQAKEMLSSVADEFGVRVIFFDGRGGPPARGGGNTHKFYSSLGGTIANHEVQLTIQGQTISSNFGSVETAIFNLEQLLTAGLEQSIFRKSKRFTPAQMEQMARMAENGYEKYIELKSRPDFLKYLEEVSTLKYYGETNIGSRPVKRGGKSELTLDNLRAIPFVSSWSQLKQNVPGYYGFGHALSKESLSELRSLYKKSRFFQTLVGNSMQSLSKSFFPLTAHLSKDEKLNEIWTMLYDEYKLTVEQLLKVSGQKSLLEDSPNGRDSIKLRESIILPVLTIQQYAITKMRSGKLSKKEEEVYQKLILRTMYGVINAGRNSA